MKIARPTSRDWLVYWAFGLAVGILMIRIEPHHDWDAVFHIVRISLMRPLLMLQLREGVTYDASQNTGRTRTPGTTRPSICAVEANR